MLRPRDDSDQPVIKADIEIVPKPRQLFWAKDRFGNHFATARFEGRASGLRFVSNIRVDHVLAHFCETDIDAVAQTYPFSYPPKSSVFAENPAPNPTIKSWAARFLREEGSARTHPLLVDITQAIHRTFRHVARHEKGIQDPVETLTLRSGSCRDLAVFMITVLHSLGIEARFVSGYLYVPDDDRTTGGNTHAWVQAYIPGPGWVDFDPSSGMAGNQNLVRVATVSNPRDAIPVEGSWIGSQSDYLAMDVSVRVDETVPGACEVLQ
jgi:transglutaminase-like putative cysteine protease